MPQTGYQPLNPQQFQKAKAAGFSTDQIIKNEQIRKSQAGGGTSTQAPAPAAPSGPLGSSFFDSAPAPSAPAPKPQSLVSKIAGAGKAVVNFLAPTVNEIGQGIAANLPSQQKNTQEVSQVAQGQQDKIVQMLKSGQINADQAKQLSAKSADSLYQTPDELQRTPLQAAGTGAQTAALLLPYGEIARGVGAGAKAIGVGSKLASLAGKVGSSAAGGYAIDVGNKLSAGQTGASAATPGLGTAIGAALPFAPKVIGAAARGVGESLGVSTGTGYGVIKEAYNAAAQGGERLASFTDALRGKIAPEEIVGEARDSLGKVVANRTKAYQADLAGLKTKTGSFDISPVIKKFSNTLEDFGVTKGKNGALDYSRSPGLGRYEGEIKKVADVLKTWGTKPGDRTIVGIDKLKQTLDDFRIGSADSRKFDAFVSGLRNEAKSLGKNEPGYLNMLSKFEQSTGVIKEIQKGLSLGDKASIDTGFRKLTSALRTNNEFRKEMIAELDKASGGYLSSKIAGQQLSEALPRGIARQIEGFGAGGLLLSGSGILPILQIAAVSSPRVVGEIVRALGLSKGVFTRLMDRIAPEGAQAPGDKFLKSPTGQKIANYAKEAQPGLSMKDVSGGKPSTIPKDLGQPAPFKGFSDLTTKILDDLKGRTTVSKQYLLDATNRPELKQAEKDVIRNALKDEPAMVNATDFANKVKTDLLPLKKSAVEYPKYENISLPVESRGPVSGYKEHIYESPIKTAAGDVHFSDTGIKTDKGVNTVKKYFAHTRTEDVPNSKDLMAYKDDKIHGFDGMKQDTRRVLELQSDLFQKGRLENESSNDVSILGKEAQTRFRQITDAHYEGNGTESTNAEGRALLEKAGQARKDELAKLEPYKNTWQDRIVREEIKQAAKDGKTKLQFPTGETAMKIEGLGESNAFQYISRASGTNKYVKLTPNDLEVGMPIRGLRAYDEPEFIVTDILGDGKFKAVSKDSGDYKEKNGKVVQAGYDAKGDEFDDEVPESDKETFDISGKVDENNPIHKFYEKELGKYLKNKFGATRITDPQGVSWYEVNVPKEKAKLPVEAFAAVPAIAGLKVPSSQKTTQSPAQRPQPLGRPSK